MALGTRTAAGALAAVLVTVLTHTAPAHAAPAEPVKLIYKLYVGGLQALKMQARVEIHQQRYDMAVRAETTGWTGTLFPFVLEARAVGDPRGDRAVPARFHTASREGGEQPRWVALTYRGPDKPPRLWAEPHPREEDGRKPVPEEARTGTLDPISAVYTLLRRAADGCNGRVPVFDGRRRFTLHATDSGRERIHDSAYTMYAGTARVCTLSLHRVHGFAAADRNRGGRGEHDGESESRYPDTIRVFLADVADNLPPLPVRLEAVTMIGALRAHLTDIKRGSAATLPNKELLPLAERLGAGVEPIQDGG